MVGGRGHPEFVDRSDEELAQIVLEILGKYTGIAARPLFQRVRRAPAAIPQYEVGHRDRVQRIRDLESQHPGLTLLGNSYDDVSLVGQMAHGC
jgi:oxygen-dependent protoporphyrinogen oxidase